MIPYLNLARRFWWLVPITALALVAAYWHVRADRAEDALLEARTIAAADLATAERAARERLQAAQDAARAERERLVAQGRAAADRAAAAEARALAAGADARRRYEAAIAADPSCAAWDQEPIRCPID